MDPKYLERIIASVRETVRTATGETDKLRQFAAEMQEFHKRRKTMASLAQSTGKPTYIRQVELYDEAIEQHGLTQAERAARQIAAHPDWSNRKIAQKLGIGKETVARARRDGPPDGPPDAPRIGLDGKTYGRKTKGKTPKLPSPNDDLIQEPCEDCETQEQFWQTSLSNVAGDAIAMQAYWTRIFGDWQSFNAPSSLITLASQAATEWRMLAEFLKRRNR